ncbi:alpha/beta hydrolase [Methylogaea oryzae]|uniref:alpha/beta hydrolase n=1 Tax=Methylogaea oryzae TaxID=1295382 RepID=UPI0006D0BBD9|nr:alpha/beta fold hydrolase [Methylogaea oryzae]
MRESEHWDDFPQRFAQALPGAEVRCLDLPGNGEHWRLNSPPNLREAMEFARREAWETADGPTAPQTPVYLLSISMGSMAALEWASRYPQEIAGAVLINTSSAGSIPSTAACPGAAGRCCCAFSPPPTRPPANG